MLEEGVFSPIFDKKDRQEIKVILYRAEEPYRTLAVQYADRVELNRVEIVDEDDIPPSSYSNHSNTIHYVYEKDRENTRGAYYSFFHELGHAIDYNYGADIQNEENWLGRKTGDDAFYSEFHTQNGTTLAEKMHTDFKNEIGSSIQEEVNAPPYASFSDAKKEQITENILANLTNRDKYFNALSEDEQDIQMAIEDKYEEILHGPENSLASDTYGGVTDKTIKGQFNHGDDYWYNWLGFRKREPNREGFAEYYARQVLYSDEHNDKGIKSAEELLPTSKEMMDEMFESMQRK